MVPPRSPPCRRCSSSLPRIHSVMRPTTGSAVAPNSVELASLTPHKLRAASRHENAVDALEERRRIVALEHLALDPRHVDLDLVGDAAVNERFRQALVGV